MKRPFLGAMLLIVATGSPALAQYKLTTLASFNFANGYLPCAGLTLSGGTLYGTTFSGGTGSYGTVFELAAGTKAFSTVVNFIQSNGSYPEAGLMCDGSLNLYGTTYEGGSTGGGTVFELPAGASTPSPMATFPFSYPYPANGTNPQSVLIRDSSGNLYGTTAYGGTSNDGTVFEVPAGGGAINTLATFSGSNGQKPVAGLTFDAAGDLYGTTQAGGANGYGEVFEWSASTHNFSSVVPFTHAKGANPNAGLISDASGNLYGTAAYGGTSNDGLVFELPLGGSSLETLATFDGANGADLRGGLLLENGILYGTTWKGGLDGDGTVFNVPIAGGSINTLATFDGANGSEPIDGLISDANGDLYGTTWYGGDLVLDGGNGEGPVFELAVPEPSSASLLAIGALALLRRLRAGREMARV